MRIVSSLIMISRPWKPSGSCTRPRGVSSGEQPVDTRLRLGRNLQRRKARLGEPLPGLDALQDPAESQPRRLIFSYTCPSSSAHVPRLILVQPTFGGMIGGIQGGRGGKLTTPRRHT